MTAVLGSGMPTLPLRRDFTIEDIGPDCVRFGYVLLMRVPWFMSMRQRSCILIACVVITMSISCIKFDCERRVDSDVSRDATRLSEAAVVN